MSWVKVDDGFWGHPKFVALSDAATALWIRALAWVNQQRTDGVIAAAALALLCRAKRPESVARELVAAGLWEPVEGGYSIHDWAEYQATKEQRAEASRAKTERQARWRRGASTSADETSCRRVYTASPDPRVDAAPHPHPIPHPHPKEDPPVGPPSPVADHETRLPDPPAEPAPNKLPARAPRSKPRTGCPGSVDPEAPAFVERWKIPPLDSRDGPEVAKMLDHHRGKGSLMADWTATWRTWQRHAATWGRGPPPSGPRAAPDPRRQGGPDELRRYHERLAEIRREAETTEPTPLAPMFGALA